MLPAKSGSAFSIDRMVPGFMCCVAIMYRLLSAGQLHYVTHHAPMCRLAQRAFLADVPGCLTSGHVYDVAQVFPVSTFIPEMTQNGT